MNGRDELAESLNEDLERLNKPRDPLLLELIDKVREKTLTDQQVSETKTIIQQISESKELDINEMNCFEGYTALHWAVSHCHEEIVNALLEAGANPNAHGHRGKTPLMWATSPEHEKILLRFIQTRVDLNQRDFYQQTALTCAASNTATSIMRLLLTHESQITQPTQLFRALEKSDPCDPDTVFCMAKLCEFLSSPRYPEILNQQIDFEDKDLLKKAKKFSLKLIKDNNQKEKKFLTILSKEIHQMPKPILKIVAEYCEVLQYSPTFFYKSEKKEDKGHSKCLFM